jgi:hypothetical protein
MVRMSHKIRHGHSKKRPGRQEKRPSHTRPGCSCIELGRAALAQKNVRVLCSIPWLASAPARVLLQTEKIDKRQRGPSVALTATFCPFCGRKYDGDSKAHAFSLPNDVAVNIAGNTLYGKTAASTNSQQGVDKPVPTLRMPTRRKHSRSGQVRCPICAPLRCTKAK